MTPQEAERVNELFDRLASLESRPRDPEAERLIAAGLERAPNAIYALVQTALVQDEALRAADARIRELEGGRGDDAQSGSFLDTMRETLFGGGERQRGSVPQVRPQGASMGVPADFGNGAARADIPPVAQQGPQRGGSFLGTAAAAAAGVIGGSLLLDSIRSMTGGNRQGVADTSASSGNSPWSGDASSSDLAKDAGVRDVGHSGGRDHADAGGERSGLFDTAEADFDDDSEIDFDIGGDSDFG